LGIGVGTLYRSSLHFSDNHLASSPGHVKLGHGTSLCTKLGCIHSRNSKPA
jgi:hypothetical protein